MLWQWGVLLVCLTLLGHTYDMSSQCILTIQPFASTFCAELSLLLVNLGLYMSVLVTSFACCNIVTLISLGCDLTPHGANLERFMCYIHLPRVVVKAYKQHYIQKTVLMIP